MDKDDLEKKYFAQFTRECKKIGTRRIKKDLEGIPTLFSGSKKKPWYCQPHGIGLASLTVFNRELSKRGETMHGKTLAAVLKKFKKYIPGDNVTYIVGDSEGIIVFPISSLPKVARHFGLRQRKASPAQLAHREKFAAKMREQAKKNK